MYRKGDKVRMIVHKNMPGFDLFNKTLLLVTDNLGQTASGKITYGATYTDESGKVWDNIIVHPDEIIRA